jgi:hypothetical protein
MRWTIRIAIVAAVLWVGYAAWPFWAVYDFANAVERRDTAAVARRVNFPAVRHSLSEQIVVAYLRLTGREARLGQFGRNMAVAAVTSLADPILAEFISAEALIEFLQHGSPNPLMSEPSTGVQAADLQALGSGSLGNIWQIFVNSEQGLRSFELAVPFSAPPARKFKLKFRLTTWTWKLSAIELPEPLRVRLAQELAKRIDRK